MALLETKYEKQSFSITTLLLAVLVLLLFFVGLRYLDPPTENGILINFGSSDTGKTTTAVVSKPIPVAQKEVVKTPQPKVEVPKEPTKEEMLTDEKSEVVVPVKEKPTPKKEIVAVQEKKKADSVQKKEETPPAPPKPDTATTDALSSILNAQATEESGDGDDLLSGDKGDADGDPYAASYYGSNLGMGTMGYGLSGRSLLSNEVFLQDCNESGTVVVRIVVDKGGRVLEADPGIKGTTNSASCLLAPARRTAMSFRWAPDAKAPDQQIGFVVIHFKLGQ